MSIQDRFSQLTHKQKVIAGYSFAGCASLLLLVACAGGIGVGIWKWSAQRQQDQVAEATKKAQEDFAKALGKALTPPDNLLSRLELQPGDVLDLDGIKIQLLSGSAGKLRYSYRGFGGGENEMSTKEDYFQVKFRVANDAKNFILQYRPPRDDFGSRVKDEFGNSYQQWHGDHQRRPVDSTVQSVVRYDPGKSLDDVFAFDSPLPTAKEFTIDIPGHHFGRPEKAVRLKLPRSFFNEKK